MRRGFESLGHLIAFAGRVLFALPQALIRPRETARQFHLILLGSLPLAVIAGLAIGIVLWMHLRGVLARFGGQEAVQYLPTALALAVSLEFAPIGAGLIVAGRSGASLGAELGSMRLTEQIDALEMLGHSLMGELVAPRVLACMLVLPLLTIFMDYLALLGSFSAEWLTSGVSLLQYQQSCLLGMRLGDTILATAKTSVFGFWIGTAGCYYGLQATGGTVGVGRAATQGVIVSTLGVLLSNVVLVRLIQILVPVP